MVDTLIIELSFLSSTISDGAASETSREFQSRDFLRSWFTTACVEGPWNPAV
jgi:hypothetical protein